VEIVGWVLGGWGLEIVVVEDWVGAFAGGARVGVVVGFEEAVVHVAAVAAAVAVAVEPRGRSLNYR
jgi:hypothetical protein